MSAGAASQFHFDTVIHVTSAAQVEQAESFTNLSLYLKKQDNLSASHSVISMFIGQLRNVIILTHVSNGLKLKCICAPP